MARGWGGGMHGWGFVWQGGAWQGDMHGRECASQGVCGRGACMAERVYVAGMHGRGCMWQGVCIATGMHGRGHVWQGECMARGMHERAVCVVGWQEKWPLQWAVYILLECILVKLTFIHSLLYLDVSPRINRALLYKDVKVSDLQTHVRLAQ